MAIVEEYYESLCFMNCKIKKFELINNNLLVYINYGLEIFPDHPLCNVHRFSDSCVVTFRNIKSSKISIHEYTNNGDDFKEERIVDNNLSNSFSYKVEYDDYYIEGVLEIPHAWISGDIIAESFFLNDFK